MSLSLAVVPDHEDLLWCNGERAFALTAQTAEREWATKISLSLFCSAFNALNWCVLMVWVEH